MFTGLIESIARVEKSLPLSDGGGVRFHLSLPAIPKDLKLGDSVAVNGCCLTVVAEQQGELQFDVSDESLARTNLGSLESGSLVNIEYAMRLGDRLGGHLVSGHVDGRGRIEQLSSQGGGTLLSLRMPRELGRYVIEKGSLCVDGVSLTVNQVVDEPEATVIEIMLIPLTMEKTRFQSNQVGDAVNLEVDMLGKYVERLRDASK